MPAAQKDTIIVKNPPKDIKQKSDDIDKAEDIFSKLYKDIPSIPSQSQPPVSDESHPVKIQNTAEKNSDDVFNKLYDNFPNNPPPIKTIPTNIYSPPIPPTTQPSPIIIIQNPQPPFQNTPPPNPPVYSSPPPQPIPAQQTPPSFSANISSQQKNPVSAALCSVFVPGLGQVYNGELEKGIGIYIAELIGWALTIFVGFYFFFLFPILWIYGIYDAYTTANQMNSNQIPARDSNTSTMVLYTIGVFAVGFILSLVIMSMMWGGILGSGINGIASGKTTDSGFSEGSNSQSVSEVKVTQVIIPVTTSEYSGKSANGGSGWSIVGSWEYYTRDPKDYLRFNNGGLLEYFHKGQKWTTGRWSKSSGSSDTYNCALKFLDSDGNVEFTVVMYDADSIVDSQYGEPLMRVSAIPY
jgi:TM2 domain-containing membrane protein YozV